MTNRGIAECMFLSPHTIDAHLKHIYVKANIHSRVSWPCSPCSTARWPDATLA